MSIPKLQSEEYWTPTECGVKEAAARYYDTVVEHPKQTSPEKELASAHWEYVKSILEVHNICSDFITVVGHHYLTAFVHGFKHGVESITER